MARVAITDKAAPAAVVRAARRLGDNIRTARTRRRLRQSDLARRAGITVPTLRRVEQGSLGTGMGAYLAALWAMGLEDQFAGLAAPASDVEGRTLQAADRGERIRLRNELDRDF